MWIDEYFHHIQQIIERCPMVSTKTVILTTRTPQRGIIKGTIGFLNATVLHFTEVVDVSLSIDKIKYRYHYQQMVSGERIFRYDNAKHHPTVRTFPHHKHIGPELITETVIEAPETSLDDVLREIVQQVLATM